MGDPCNCNDEILEKRVLESTVVKVSGVMSIRDITGGWKARWNIGRMKYRVKAGLYMMGDPDENSEVFVTANYKMSFDSLRKNINGTDAWILVLETYGINVWCAAGKDTFGTNELINRINLTGLNKIVSHKHLIVPQLGAPGIEAHEVKKKTGFKVIYGPVRSGDINKFIANGFKADPGMRRITFNLSERLVLTPVEFVHSLKFSPILLILLFLIDIIIGNKGLEVFYRDILIFFGAVVTGTILFPVLLPVLPFRSFALKGWILGLIYTAAADLAIYNSISGNYVHLLTIPVLVSFLSYNFTGSSTYTSLSGVEKELKISLPLYGFSILSGLGVLLLNFF